MRTWLCLALALGGCNGDVTGGGSDGGGPPPGGWDDFPSAPIIDTGAPKDAPGLFGDADAGGGGAGPCLLDPEIGALFPRNWLRMRFHFAPAPGENLFEIRVHAADEANDLVVYTAQTTWTMPLDVWQKVTAHLVDRPITVAVRGAAWDAMAMKLASPPALGTRGDVTIAPVAADGAIVYWTTTGGSALKGFSIGQESVVAALAPPQVQMKTAGGAQVTCIGCHTSTPDGLYAGFTAQGPWGNALASVDAATVGQAPPFLGAGAIAALGQPQLGIQTYSRAHWAQGDHVQVAPFGHGPGNQLAWFDLEAQDASQGKAYGFIARDGDGRGVGAPVWSHDGATIVYVSSDAATDGRLATGDADLYAVPYNSRAGGKAKAIPGASDPGVEEYYPALSADDALLAFDRIPSGNNMYNQPLAELYVLPAQGGMPTRLKANDPPACSGKTSPGITNSWPKWSPEAPGMDNRTFYWLTFSSTRSEKGNPQLYVTAIVVTRGEALQQISTYGALYLWNQPADENNHTPAWDNFQIPLQ